jgi:hypothetical protein
VQIHKTQTNLPLFLAVVKYIFKEAKTFQNDHDAFDLFDQKIQSYSEIVSNHEFDDNYIW